MPDIRKRIDTLRGHLTHRVLMLTDNANQLQQEYEAAEREMEALRRDKDNLEAMLQNALLRLSDYKQTLELLGEEDD